MKRGTNTKKIISRLLKWKCQLNRRSCRNTDQEWFSNDEPKDDEKAWKDDVNEATTAITELDDQSGEAWAAEEVEDEPDWFKSAIAEMDCNAKLVTKEIPVRDWFDEVVEGDNESRTKGAT